MRRVTGIGGLFFKCEDVEAQRAWYREHLGIEANEYGFTFKWREEKDSSEVGYTQWSPFAAKSDYFSPSKRDFMFNYRVDDLDALLIALKQEGVTQVGDALVEENGKFAWVLDPEGNKVELWEPVPSKEDPYL